MCPSQGRGWRSVRGMEIRRPASSSGSAAGRVGGGVFFNMESQSKWAKVEDREGGKEGERLIPAHIPSSQG